MISDMFGVGRVPTLDRMTVVLPPVTERPSLSIDLPDNLASEMRHVYTRSLIPLVKPYDF